MGMWVEELDLLVLQFGKASYSRDFIGGSRTNRLNNLQQNLKSMVKSDEKSHRALNKNQWAEASRAFKQFKQLDYELIGLCYSREMQFLPGDYDIIARTILNDILTKKDKTQYRELLHCLEEGFAAAPHRANELVLEKIRVSTG